MVERVNTGGVMSFDYSKAEKSKLGKELKKDIKRGYMEYYYRKRREKRRKLMIIILVIIVIVGGLLAVFLR